MKLFKVLLIILAVECAADDHEFYFSAGKLNSDSFGAATYEYGGKYVFSAGLLGDERREYVNYEARVVEVNGEPKLERVELDNPVVRKEASRQFFSTFARKFAYDRYYALLGITYVKDHSVLEEFSAHGAIGARLLGPVGIEYSNIDGEDGLALKVNLSF